MIKKLFSLGVICVMSANACQRVEYWRWDSECQAKVSEIVYSPVCRQLCNSSHPNYGEAIMELRPQLDYIKPRLNTLSGGATAIYDRLIASWSTGDEVWDYVPANLAELAELIWAELRKN